MNCESQFIGTRIVDAVDRFRITGCRSLYTFDRRPPNGRLVNEAVIPFFAADLMLLQPPLVTAAGYRVLILANLISNFAFTYLHDHLGFCYSIHFKRWCCRSIKWWGQNWRTKWKLCQLSSESHPFKIARQLWNCRSRDWGQREKMGHHKSLSAACADCMVVSLWVNNGKAFVQNWWSAILQKPIGKNRHKYFCLLKCRSN